MITYLEAALLTCSYLGQEHCPQYQRERSARLFQLLVRGIVSVKETVYTDDLQRQDHFPLRHPHL